MAKQLTRREFLMASLFGAGGLAGWLTLHPERFLSGRQSQISSQVAGWVAAREGKTLLVDRERAKQVYEMMMKQFAIPGKNLFKEFSDKRPSDHNAAYLWPFTGVIAAVMALYRMPGGESYRSEVERLMKGLEDYYDPSMEPRAYASYILSEGGGGKYYDDNQWVGLVLSDAYRIFKDESYLKRSIEIFNFSASSWTDDLDGGMYWRQYDLRTKNTCSNAPAAIHALMLYQDTGKQEYLDWGLRIMKWLARLRSPVSAVYWDSINTADGGVDRTTWTYNTGTPMQANALLYQVTGDSQYLEETRALAAGSLEHFDRDDRGLGVRQFPITPWFNTVLMRGYLALYQVDPKKDRTYLNAMKENLDYAWLHARNSDNLFGIDWSGLTGRPDFRYHVLDQAAMVELYAMLAQTETI